MPREIRTNELLALKEIAELLNTTNDMNEMLNDVLHKLMQVTAFTTGWIFLTYDHPGNLCAAWHRLPPALTAGNYSLMCGEDCSCIIRYKQNGLDRATNIIECKRISYAIANEVGDTEGITHHATVPLNAGSESFGLLNVAMPGKVRYSEDELALLQAVALQIGMAIKRIRLYQAQERNAALYAKLGDVIQRINSIPDLNQLQVKAVHIIGDAFDWAHVSLFIHRNQELSLRAQYKENRVDEKWEALSHDESGLVSKAFRHNRLIIESHSGEECPSTLSEVGVPHYVSAAAIPLRARGRPFGVLLISSPNHEQFDELHEDFMYSLGDHLTLSIENLRIYEQRSELALLEERNRMARDLHDSVIQKVFSLSFMAKGAEAVLGGDSPIVKQSLQEIGQLSQEVLKEMRELIWQLRPAGLENGLLPALKQHGQTLDLTVYERAEGIMELPRAIEEALWRIGQEALNNVKKHAGTNVAYIRLTKSETGTSLEITDKGTGFSSEKKKGKLTMGMMSMRERAEALGGEITISSGKGQASTVKVTIPIHVVEEKCSEEKEQL